MIDQYRQLVAEIADLTGAEPPRLTRDDAPVLSEQALREDGRGFYLVGLIGGKDVGKSALVNALVGRSITAQTSHGPGTEIVIAYAHVSQADALRGLLEQQVPGQYRIVTHAIDELSRQVLLDLPDIDSHYAAHVEVTRRMLRHMLYPIWIQSVEKYADQAPRELLSMVAAGNAPGNFIFCLNKADQVVRREGEAAARELKEDYAQRLGRLLNMPEPPRVWLISALNPGQFDLPGLRQTLAREKSEQAVDHSIHSAIQRQGLSLAQWIERQDLAQRLGALERLERASEEELAGRIGVPLIDRAIPSLLDDPVYRLTLGDELMRERVGRWPIVNVLHVLFSPLMNLLRRRLPLPQQRALQGADELVDEHLRALDGSASGAQSCAGLVQSTFAQLQQSSPLVSRLYAQRKLWEASSAEMAAADLRRRLAETVERQRQAIRQRATSYGAMGALMRIILTIGALIWFPLVQPVLLAWLEGQGRLLTLVVRVLGVSYLLHNLLFLLLYFGMLWLGVKWSTQRKVDRWLSRWKGRDDLDPALSLTGQVVEWSNSVLEPIRAARRRLAELVGRAAELRQSLETQAA